MKSVFALILVIVFSQGCQQPKQELPTPISTYYLIRHAEKDRSNPKNHDPYLTEKGMDRAELWARIFKKVTFDEIYSTNYKRTLQTITAVGMDNNTEVKIYHPDSLVTPAFREQTLGKNVLIVGHSNTTPRVVNQLIEDEHYKDMDDSDNGSLYIVTLAGGGKTVEILDLN